jgi:hypothetical protein
MNLSKKSELSVLVLCKRSMLGFRIVVGVSVQAVIEGRCLQEVDVRIVKAVVGVETVVGLSESKRVLHKINLKSDDVGCVVNKCINVFNVLYLGFG